jgi:hypothetical protein
MSQGLPAWRIVGETVTAAQEGGLKRREALPCPGPEVYETAAPFRRFPDTPELPLP